MAPQRPENTPDTAPLPPPIRPTVRRAPAHHRPGLGFRRFVAFCGNQPKPGWRDRPTKYMQACGGAYLFSMQSALRTNFYFLNSKQEKPRCHQTSPCCMLHVPYCMLYVACCMLRVACSILHVVCCMFHVACCMLHVHVRKNSYIKKKLQVTYKTHVRARARMSHVVCCMLRVACFTLHVAPCTLHGACRMLHVAC